MENKDILQRVEELKLRKVKASINFTDQYQKIVSHKAKQTKTLLGKGKNLTPEDIVAANLSNMFYHLLDKFKGGHKKLPAALPCKRGISYWHRVARLCLEAKIDHAVFLKAQFAYFRKAFGKPPEFSQLVTASALARAVEYAKTHKSIPTYIASTTRPFQMSISEKMHMADKRMRAVCKAQDMTREEVYTQLVLPGFLLFPAEYTSADPEYAKAVNG